MDDIEDEKPYYEEEADGDDDSDYERSDETQSEEEEDEELEEEEFDDLGDASQDAENEIEGDFDRLIANIRDSDGASGSEMMTKQWDFTLEDKDAEFRDDLRAASGIGRRRRKTNTRQVGPVLSQQVKALVGEGNQAFVDGDIPATIRIMQEVIRIEPRAASAWAVLAQCYADLKDPLKEELGYNQQALYCYRKLYSLDPTNVDALWDRATLATELGELRTARHSYLAILKRFPHDLTTLESLRPLLIELSDLKTCADLFQAAFNHYSAVYPIPIPNPDLDQPPSPFGQMEVLCLTDLYNTLGQHEQAIHAIKSGSRWLQGRRDEAYWDMCEDDREFDLRAEEGDNPIGAVTREREGDLMSGHFPLDVNARHRLAIARIKMGDIEEGKMHANIVLGQDFLDYAPLFGEIADAYFEKEMYSEAGVLYELLGEDPVTSNLSILLNAAACRRMLGNLKEAVELYKTVIDADPTHNDAKMKLAELYEILDEPRKALELVYQVIDARGRSRSGREQTEQPSENSGVLGASLFEESIRADKKTRGGRSQKLTSAQLKELEEQKENEVVRSWKRIQELWPTKLGQGESSNDTESVAAREAAAREWMVEAEKLVEMFRETRALFLTGKNSFRGVIQHQTATKQNAQLDEHRMASRLELLEQTNSAQRARDGQQKAVNSTAFRGVSFEHWMKLFIQYSFQLTKSGQFELADEVLRHVSFSNTYQSLEKKDTLHYALIACALLSRRYDVVVEQCRKLITTHQFNNEAIRILLASLASGWRPTDAFIIATLQKHLLRELRIHETAVKAPDLLKWIPHSKRYAPKIQKGEECDDVVENEDELLQDEDADTSALSSKDNPTVATFIPTKPNPIALAVYGQISIDVRSYQTALYYLLQAYDLAPEDPMICLNAAIASIGRSMQRQADNRHHLVAQGLAFLSRYRNLRKAVPGGVHEVEFNFGRAFQQLGLYSHAVKHYERVLEIQDGQPTDYPLPPPVALNHRQSVTSASYIPYINVILIGSLSCLPGYEAVRTLDDGVIRDNSAVDDDDNFGGEVMESPPPLSKAFFQAINLPTNHLMIPKMRAKSMAVSKGYAQKNALPLSRAPKSQQMIRESKSSTSVDNWDGIIPGNSTPKSPALLSAFDDPEIQMNLLDDNAANAQNLLTPNGSGCLLSVLNSIYLYLVEVADSLKPTLRIIGAPIWVFFTGCAFLLFPQYIDMLVFRSGYASAEIGIQRIKVLADLSAAAQLFLFTVVLVMYSLRMYFYFVIAIAGVLIGQFAMTWRQFQFSQTIPLGENDHQTIYRIFAKKDLGITQETLVRSGNGSLNSMKSYSSIGAWAM
ncbi:hypothetical protein HWV62_40398 [Athelia sp. TMB]|nr:hypothetical protein HWV62_40398 [Athelia sp. TMB]